jgi:hypothetical protein
MSLPRICGFPHFSSVFVPDSLKKIIFKNKSTLLSHENPSEVRIISQMLSKFLHLCAEVRSRHFSSFLEDAHSHL